MSSKTTHHPPNPTLFITFHKAYTQEGAGLSLTQSDTTNRYIRDIHSSKAIIPFKQQQNNALVTQGKLNSSFKHQWKFFSYDYSIKTHVISPPN